MHIVRVRLKKKKKKKRKKRTRSHCDVFNNLWVGLLYYFYKNPISRAFVKHEKYTSSPDEAKHGFWESSLQHCKGGDSGILDF